ncbi:glycosyltransferase family 8 protein [Diaporthe sp. PMI_573]|nr:glycosyltransferase family 8 protein [Diaporthaceae sp. PMI_573]
MPGKHDDRKFDEDVLPDFLENSPFLPVWNETASRKAASPRAASTTQLLRSKPARLAYGVLLLIFILLWLRSVHVYDRLTGPSCYFRAPVAPNDHWRSTTTDWKKYAYSLYATDSEYLCNAVMIFDDLRQYGSKAERLLLYPDAMNINDGESRDGKLLVKARDELGVKLQPVKVLHEESAADSGPNWADSYTKLLAFKQTQYSRLITIDSDSLLLGSLDELFFVPPAPAVMPRAYWLSKPTMSSHIMVLTPSADAFQKVENIIERRAGKNFYDMEIMNALYGGTCEVIPHGPYALLTGEFRKTDHAGFFKSQSGRVWDPKDVLKQAKMVHFSDSPLPKPWVATDERIFAAKPDCSFDAGTGEECRAQEIWLEFYKKFREKRNVSQQSPGSSG